MLPFPFLHLSAATMQSVTTTCFPTPDDIDLSDTTFQLRPGKPEEPDQTLLDSISSCGIMVPPLLRRTQQGYQILSGRKRILAAQQLGLETPACLVLADNVDQQALFRCLLLHARTGSELSVIELARLFFLAEKELNRDQLSSLLPLAGLKAKPHLIPELVALLDQDSLTRQALHEGRLQPATVTAMERLSPADREELVRLILALRLGGSKQRKLVGLGVEICMRTGMPLTECIKPWQEEVANMQQENRPQQAASLLGFLERICSPRLTGAEERFRQLQGSVTLPPFMRLTHTPSFEDDTLTLSIDYGSEEEFLKHWQVLRAHLPES